MNFLIKNCCKIIHQTSEYRKSDGIMPGYPTEKWQINNRTPCQDRNIEGIGTERHLYMQRDR